VGWGGKEGKVPQRVVMANAKGSVCQVVGIPWALRSWGQRWKGGETKQTSGIRWQKLVPGTGNVAVIANAGNQHKGGQPQKMENQVGVRTRCGANPGVGGWGRSRVNLASGRGKVGGGGGWGGACKRVVWGRSKHVVQVYLAVPATR